MGFFSNLFGGGDDTADILRENHQQQLRILRENIARQEKIAEAERQERQKIFAQNEINRQRYEQEANRANQLYGQQYRDINDLYGQSYQGINALYGDTANAATDQYGLNTQQALNQYLGDYLNYGKPSFDTLQTQYNTLLNNPSEIQDKFSAGFKESPAYQYKVEQATRAANNAAAAGGYIGTPQHQEELARQIGMLASEDFDRYSRNNMGLYGQGLAGLENLGNTGYNAALQSSSAYNDMLRNQAQLLHSTAFNQANFGQQGALNLANFGQQGALNQANFGQQNAINQANLGQQAAINQAGMGQASAFNQGNLSQNNAFAQGKSYQDYGTELAKLQAEKNANSLFGTGGFLSGIGGMFGSGNKNTLGDVMSGVGQGASLGAYGGAPGMLLGGTIGGLANYFNRK